MIFDIRNPSLYYSLFFALAHIVSWSVLIWHGIKHKYAIVQWLLIIVTGYITFTIGTHLLSFDVLTIKRLITEGIWPVSQGKSLIGGLLLAVPSMLLIKYVLGFKQDIFTPYAFTIPIGIAIQRLGCFGVGCCHGKTTLLPWGIKYAFGNQVHFSHWNQNLISTHELNSLAVHPVQLYESILCLLAFILVIFIFKKKWIHGRLIYFSLFLYTIIRFITEIFRASEAHTIGVFSFMGLNTFQWIMLFTSIFFLYILTKRVKIKLSGAYVNHVKKSSLLKVYIWYFLLFALVLITQKFYSPLELLLLGLLFIPLSALVFWKFFKSINIPQLRVGTVSFCVTGIFLMSQNSPIILEESESNKYHEISIGGYADINNMTQYSRGCDGDIIKHNEFKENYYLMGVGYKYVNEINADKKFTAGIGASYGKLKEHVENNDYDYEQDTYIFSPFVKYDLKKIGFGVGIMAGDISLYRPYGSTACFTAFERYSVLPQVHFRVGNHHKTWGEFNYGLRFPGVSPGNEYELL